MSDKPEKNEEKGYTPASPVKRTMAWIGVVYMLILLALTTYFYFTGTGLRNLGPLLTVPGRPGKGAAITITVLCWLLAAAALPIGIIGLMSNFSQLGITVFITTGG